VADIIALDRDIYRLDANDIHNAKVDLTILGSKIVSQQMG